MKWLTMTKALRLGLICAATVFAFNATAGEATIGRVILQISGAITNTNGDGVMRFDRAGLEALGMHDITTQTPWTEGMATFTGVRASDLMAYVGASGSRIRAIALNDYAVEIPVVDFDAYDVILALEKDGEVLSIRDRGPLWVIYPWSALPDLQNELYYSRSIWQLRELQVNPN